MTRAHRAWHIRIWVTLSLLIALGYAVGLGSRS